MRDHDRDRAKYAKMYALPGYSNSAHYFVRDSVNRLLDNNGPDLYGWLEGCIEGGLQHLEVEDEPRGR